MREFALTESTARVQQRSGTARMVRLCVLLVALCVCLCAALNDDGPNTDSPLSDGAVNRVSEDVGEGGEKKIADQEALLGGKAARQRLIDLPPEQGKKELKKLVSRIDADGSGRLSPGELVEWMVRVEREHQARDVGNRWEQADKDEDGFVTLEEYAQTISVGDDSEPHLEEVVAQSQPLFSQADTDKDDRLTREEFAAFINPESHPHMLSALVQTFQKEFDTDGDGYITYDEYMAMYMPQSAVEGGELPEWAESEKAQFEEVLDKNKDGRLDTEEMKAWIGSGEVELAEEETANLLKEADKDGDGELSVDEVLEEFDLFMDSQITDFGHARVGHDEL